MNIYLKKFGSRIRTQLSSIKRPLEIAAKELKIDIDILQKCIKGQLNEKEVINIVYKICDIYPIKLSDIFLEKNDTDNGIVYCSKEQSDKSKRTILRKNKDGIETEYYTYYDCAINKHCPFKPELIDMLRVVDDNDSYNNDVAYNRGHLETQMTFYINEVNLYYEVNNKKYCIETNTGDSSIHIPYIPHTFTKRTNSDSKIIAVTFSSNIANNISNLSYISHHKLESIAGNSRNTKELFNIRLNRYLELNFMTKNMLIDKLKNKFSYEDIQNYFEKHIFLNNISNSISSILNINPENLLFTKLEDKHEFIYKKNCNKYFKINNLLINNLSISKHIKNVSNFNIKILDNTNYNFFESSYYQFIYNYSKNSFLFKWGDKLNYQKTINSGDSIIIFPFVKHSFHYIDNEVNFYLAKIPGVLNENILNEYSLFDINNRYRLCDNETDKWW